MGQKLINFWTKSQSTFGPKVNRLLGQKSINFWGQKSINFCATQSTLSEKSITPVIISAPRENQVPAKGSKACRNTDNFEFRHTKCNFLSHIKLLRMPWVAVALCQVVHSSNTVCGRQFVQKPADSSIDPAGPNCRYILWFIGRF